MLCHFVRNLLLDSVDDSLKSRLGSKAVLLELHKDFLEDSNLFSSIIDITLESFNFHSPDQPIFFSVKSSLELVLLSQLEDSESSVKVALSTSCNEFSILDGVGQVKVMELKVFLQCMDLVTLFWIHSSELSIEFVSVRETSLEFLWVNTFSDTFLSGVNVSFKSLDCTSNLLFTVWFTKVDQSSVVSFQSLISIVDHLLSPLDGVGEIFVVAAQ